MEQAETLSLPSRWVAAQLSAICHVTSSMVWLAGSGGARGGGALPAQQVIAAPLLCATRLGTRWWSRQRRWLSLPSMGVDCYLPSCSSQLSGWLDHPLHLPVLPPTHLPSLPPQCGGVPAGLPGHPRGRLPRAPALPRAQGCADCALFCQFFNHVNHGWAESVSARAARAPRSCSVPPPNLSLRMQLPGQPSAGSPAPWTDSHASCDTLLPTCRQAHCAGPAGREHGAAGHPWPRGAGKLEPAPTSWLLPRTAAAVHAATYCRTRTCSAPTSRPNVVAICCLIVICHLLPHVFVSVQLKEKHTAISYRDVMSAAMYPKVFEEYK